MHQKTGIFNNAGQHWNHIMFWQCMKPNGGGAMPSELENRIISDFGSVDKKHTKRHDKRAHKYTKPHKYAKPHKMVMRKTLATRKNMPKQSKKSTRRKKTRK